MNKGELGETLNECPCYEELHLFHQGCKQMVHSNQPNLMKV